MSRYCEECLKKAKDDCDGTQPRPTYQVLAGQMWYVFEVNGRRHGLNFCRGYEFNPQDLPQITSDAGSQAELKKKIKKAKADGVLRRAENRAATKKRNAAARAKKKQTDAGGSAKSEAEKIQQKIDEATIIAEETLAEERIRTETSKRVKVNVPKNDDGLPSFGSLEDLLI